MSEWMDGVEWSGVDTSQTVMTTRAPAVLIKNILHRQQATGFRDQLQEVHFAEVKNHIFT